MTADAGRPVVIRGNPEPEELAALLVLMSEPAPRLGATASWRKTRLAALRRHPRG